MKEKIPCDLIKDMIPLYKEKLCSEKTEKIISEHLAECEECRKLISDISIPETNISAVPDESSAFKKINRKIKLGKRKIRILAAFLVVIIGILIYLTAGQILKNYSEICDLQSFETVFQSIEVRSIAKEFASGNIDEFVKHISYDNIVAETNNKFLSEDIRKEETKVLKKLYDDSYGKKKIKKIKIKTEYSFVYVEKKLVPITTADIIYTDNDTIFLYFFKGSDGFYIVYPQNNFDTKLMQCILHMSWHDMCLRDFYKNSLEKATEPIDSTTKNRFSYEYKEKASVSISSFFEKGFTVDNCTFSKLFYDKEKNMTYVDTIITASDNKGKAIMQTKLYIDYFGLLIPDSEYSVVTDGCTDELKESLMHFFG